ncbi:SRPBCC domain-containing protein [Parvularcula marina]|uniref:SRPBCC domain-containing protein n=2 Tax=Parvularcula marina TaxID=2292771 RepID=A0A371RGP6_9PROT|nr:SRPBCC domain-containing protein [Parvularcula marina]
MAIMRFTQIRDKSGAGSRHKNEGTGMSLHYKVVAETLIDASAERVWAILTDFAGYDDWNPMLTEMSGKPEVGSDLRFIVTDAKGSRRRMGGKVHEVIPGRRLEWRGGNPVTFIGHHFFELHPVGETTRFIHGEVYFGLGPLFLRPVLNARAAPLYPALNEALKARAEAQE